MAQARHTKEEYLLLRVMGKTRSEIAEEWNVLPTVLDFRLSKWKVLTNDAEQAALAAYQASLPAPPEPPAALPEQPEPPSTPATAEASQPASSPDRDDTERIWLKFPLVSRGQSVEMQALAVSDAMQELDKELTKYRSRERVAFALVELIGKVTDLLIADIAEILPPEKVPKKVRFLLIKANREYVETLQDELKQERAEEARA